MGIADVDRASDKTFRSELNAYLDKEAEKEREAEMAEDYAKHLLEEGEEFHPWTFAHFEEAIANASYPERMTAYVTIATAVELHLSNVYSNHMAVEALRQLVENYWEEAAKQKARTL